jgi:hypothetical protein
LNKTILREVENEGCLFVERCRDLIPAAAVIERLSRSGERVPSDAAAAVRTGDIHSIAALAKELKLSWRAVRLGTAAQCESLLTPRRNSSSAVQRELAPAQTLLISLLLTSSDRLKAVQTVCDLLGLDLSLSDRKAAEGPLITVAKGVFFSQWSGNGYQMLEACASAMALLHFDPPSNVQEWPKITDGVFDWGDGTKRFRLTQREVMELLVANRSGIGRKETNGRGMSSLRSAASRIRKALKVAKCPWTVQFDGDRYQLVRSGR